MAIERPKGKDRIIVALDTPSIAMAGILAEKLQPFVGGFKIGLEFLTALAVQVLTLGFGDEAELCLLRITLFNKVFWDGKWNDIPNTLAGAAKAVSPLAPKFFNVHASAGIDAMKAAVENRGDSMVLAVTVLTSLGEECQSIFGGSAGGVVEKFALMAKKAGVDGIICSPKEIRGLRQYNELKEILLVTPGIRPAGADQQDQKRVMTPGECVLAGGDYMVIGRPITGAEDPVVAVRIITEEIEAAEAELAAKG